MTHDIIETLKIEGYDLYRLREHYTPMDIERWEWGDTDEEEENELDGYQVMEG